MKAKRTWQACSDRQLQRRLKCALVLIPEKGLPFSGTTRRRMKDILERAIASLERRERLVNEWSATYLGVKERSRAKAKESHV